MRSRLISTVAVASIAALVACAGERGEFDVGRLAGLDPDTRLPVAFGLARDQDGLVDRVEHLSDPDHPDFRRWMSVADVAEGFGADERTARRVLDHLETTDFVGEIDSSRGLIIGTISIADAADLLSVDFTTSVNGDRTTIFASTPPVIPTPIADHVTGVLGLEMALGPDTDPWPTGDDRAVTCPDLPAVEDMLREQYELPASTGAVGSAVSVAVLAVSAISQRALDLAGRCHGFEMPPTRTVAVDDTPRSVFGAQAVETTLDAAALGVVAPGLDEIVFYQFNPKSRLAFPLSAIVEDLAKGATLQVISASVGVCETARSAATIAATDWLILTAAATGVSTLAAAGDDGSTDCPRDRTVPGVRYPASSPFVTAVGGTQFASSAEWLDAVVDPIGWRERDTEVVWDQRPHQNVASGGGYSRIYTVPWYQRGMVTSGARVLPDVAFLASSQAYGRLPLCSASGKCVFAPVGGTSAAAPGFAGALVALADAVRDRDGTPGRFGLLNPALYHLARVSVDAFDDITEGSNDLRDVGCCTATIGFDPASGLGSLNVDHLAAFYRARPAP